MGTLLVECLHGPQQCEEIAAAFALYDERCERPYVYTHAIPQVIAGRPS
ncbi:hypothetical protein B0G69_6290 [Paraburkholderia sp. RAU2J]|nr:hypothetical protein B0G69_6290 [Paraburkholderia sp. RAU2J]